ncbi:CRISPR-associated endonuclease Cas1 [Limnohabitans sp.]|uniref:CRISPR-associated endonuclease Cas1 n=1 Tax=Limnohabitans sp. TaxID=1907725 RepID=UPI0037C160B5
MHNRTLHPCAMNAMPLYLHNGSAQRLDLDAAQRLRIERKDLPERRIPLHHVSRIVCSSTLDISAKALMACMKNGIPLAVIDPSGQTLGWCLGARRKETSLRQLLTHALDDPAWTSHYPDWLKQQHAAIAAQTLLLCGVPTTATARHNPRVALCNAHFVKHQQGCAQAVDALALLAQHELAAQLVQETGAPELLAWHRPGLNLIADLGQVIGLHAHTDLHHAPLLPTPDQLTAWAVKNYERHAAHWQQRIGQLMYAFEQFLRNHWL